MLRRIAGRIRSPGGYTLVELVVVLAIFMLIVTSLTKLFTSGAQAELDLNRRFQAQQEARNGLDRLRRELHCSSGITATPGTPVSSITVALPAQCPSARGVARTIVYDMFQVSTNRWKMRRTMNGSTVTIADYITKANGLVFTYTAPSSTTRGLLHVDLPVNVHPNEGWKQWRLVDDIVLRNTLRQ
ncbi:MAG TPA: type II secretion system protein [Gaiellaceae bacterium]|nr:type II secretion system protein [Gaiellaceae bacterium]